MVEVVVTERNTSWYGIAMSGSSFVATAVGHSREAAQESLLACIPDGLEFTQTNEPSPLALEAAEMLDRLEAGDESTKSFVLSREHLTGPAYRIYGAAAQIPIGYITTYGAIARVARSEARAVGRAMATNALYPIVPCHRVVGSDFSMVGYGGRQDRDAIEAKLGRLEAERKGAPGEDFLNIHGAFLPIYPVEWAIEATRNADERIAWRKHQEEMERADREAQLSLF